MNSTQTTATSIESAKLAALNGAMESNSNIVTNGASNGATNGSAKFNTHSSNGKINRSNRAINSSNGKMNVNGSHGQTNASATKFVSLAAGLSEVDADARIAGSFSGLHSVDSLAALYDDFAKDYEKAYSAVEYEGPQNVASALRAELPSSNDDNTIVLDAGCGSGLVGEAVRAQGFKRVVGIDYSEGMLALAKAKDGVYEQLEKADLTEPLSFEDNQFGAVVSCGVFTAGHVDKEAIRELARIVYAGGLICIGCQEHVYEREGFPAFIAVLEKEGLLKQVRRTIAYAMRKTKTQMTIVTLRVC